MLALGAFALLAVVHTWPLASNPAHLSRNDNGDALLNVWAIAWVAHQLPRDPGHLFDANIFYPERLTLGYSEAMIVQGVLAMPILALGGSPVLAFNLLLMAGMALTGWAFCLLVSRWTGSWAAGYVAGSLAAFNSHVLVRLPHLQTQHVEFIPLILFALDRVIALRRVRDALLLGAAFALQGLTSIYLLVFTTWMLIFASLGRAREWLREGPTRMIGLFAIAGIAATLLLAPYLLPYYQVHRLTGFSRTIGEAQRYTGSWLDYLTTGSRVHYDLWSSRFWPGAASATFPGFIGLGLAATALARREIRQDSRVRMCFIAALGCATVSMLPLTPIYPVLHEIIPLFRPVRVPARIGQIVLMMLAVVAGFGVATMRARWRTLRAWPALAAVLVAAVNVEALRAPFKYQRFSEIPRPYDVLAGERGAVVVELPIYRPRDFLHNAPYMLYSTRHWRPLLNGYSGFRSASYEKSYAAAQGFPHETSLIALHDLGVTHVVVHGEIYGPTFVDLVNRTGSLSLIASDGVIHIYRLK
ncbi:MAG TPA: hypothetical protein VHJ77_04515 [Vicinamibacterales bacterium]|nr:hypothetical protein [Vicinamibacterales bacterium]